MKIQVKKDVESIRTLCRASIPYRVIEQIIGSTYEANPAYEISVPWNENKNVTWTLPPETCTVIEP